MRPLAEIVDYWSGELALEESDRFEEHLFECSECTGQLEKIARMESAVRDLIRGGRVSFPVTRVLFERMATDGLVMREYRLVPNESVPCTVGSEDHFGVAWLEGDLGDADRVDVDFIDEASSRSILHLDDVPFDRARGEVGMATSADFLRTLPATVFLVRMMPSLRGEALPVATYRMMHTPYERG